MFSTAFQAAHEKSLGEKWGFAEGVRANLDVVRFCLRSKTKYNKYQKDLVQAAVCDCLWTEQLAHDNGYDTPRAGRCEC
eukprot:4545820-Pyramimonas_sp.AAC.1